MPVLTQGRYTDACKTEAVRLVSESGRPVAQIARELGIPYHVRYLWVSGERHAQAQGTTPESMCGCARNEIVYDGRLRASRASLHEIPRDPGARPSRSHPADVPRTRRVGCGL
jgi:transposase-like protein